MNLLDRYTNTLSFRDYDDFYRHFRLHVPKNFNFAYNIVDEYARLDPQKRAMVWCDDLGGEEFFTFGDIKRISDKTANYFLSLGIGKGDRVLVILQRRHEYWTTLMALSKIGAIGIPATHMLMEKDLVYRMEKASVKMVVAVNEPELCNNIRSAAEKVACVKHLASVGKYEGFRDFDADVEAQPDTLENLAYKAERKADDILLLYFTSGTTGMPKMVCLSQRYTLGHIVTARFWHKCEDGGLHFTLAETGWAKASWGKLFGQWACGSALFVYDFHGKFEPDDLMNHIAKYKITTFCAPPTVYRFMIKTDLSKYDLSSIRYMMTAGEALNPEIYKQIVQKTGHKIYEGFGQTETTVVCATFPGLVDIRPGSMGKPSPLYDVQLLDDNGAPVETGAGEICIRLREEQQGLFSGYYNDPALTETVIYDGYYHLGDLAYRDTDGYYWFVGRKDDIIKSSGYRIGPFEVESALMEHPAVLECAITGVPDTEGVRGQLVKATIVLAKGYEPSDALVKELQNHVKKTTAPYKYPRVVEFVKELPKTISGKIRRVETGGRGYENFKTSSRPTPGNGAGPQSPSAACFPPPCF